MRGLTHTVDTLSRDVRHSLRQLARHPLFTTTAVVTLAVGIGANAAIFSIVDGVLFRALPFPQPERLAVVSSTYQAQGEQWTQTAQTGTTWETVRDHATSVERAVFSNWTSGVNLAADDFAAYVQQQRVGAGFFRVLGVAPMRGREFTDAEDRPGGARVVVLSHELWQRQLGGEEDVLVSTLTLKGEPHTVVGVMPAGFHGTADADLWTPLRASTEGEGGGTNYGILVRPQAGVSMEQATAEIAALGERIQRQRGDERQATFGLQGLREAQTANLEGPLLILWAVAGLVLVVVCVNLAHLMLARWHGRQREIAARMALGSGRGGIARQVLVESGLLALGGAVAGVVLGRFSLVALVELARDTVGLTQPVTLDARVVGVTLLLALLASLLFGLGPALRASRLDVRGVLAGGGAGTTDGGATGWPRRLLVVAEVAVGVLLVVFAGLLVRSFLELRGLEPGFEPAGVVAGSVSLQDARYDTRPEVERLFEDSLERLRALPGVEAAAVGLGLPFERPLNLLFQVVGGEAQRTAVSARYVTPGYFETLQLPLLGGRGFRAGDRAGAAPVVVVNEELVRRYLDAEGSPAQALGRVLDLAGGERRIVGVAGDVLVNPRGLGGDGPLGHTPMVYLPVGQVDDETLRLVHTWFEPSWIVRSGLPPGTVAGGLESALREVAPRLPLARFQTLPEVALEALGFQRFLMTLVVALAGVALLLAAVGIYGLVAQTVGARTRELGIRLALGARRRQALGTVVAPTVALAVVGAAVGVGLALSLARLVSALVWGVSPTDPWSLAVGAGGLVAVATVASVLPGLRVLRLDPARTLRRE